MFTVSDASKISDLTQTSSPGEAFRMLHSYLKVEIWKNRLSIRNVVLYEIYDYPITALPIS